MPFQGKGKTFCISRLKSELLGEKEMLRPEMTGPGYDPVISSQGGIHPGKQLGGAANERNGQSKNRR